MTAYYRLPRSIFDTTDADVPQGYAGFSQSPQLGSFVLYEQPLTLDETLKYMLTYAGEKPASKAQIQAVLGSTAIIPKLPCALVVVSKARGKYRLPVTPAVICLPAPDREICCTECVNWFLGCLNGRERWKDKAITPNWRYIRLSDGTGSTLCDAFSYHPDPRRKGRAVYD
jgi:hypothetical protein